MLLRGLSVVGGCNRCLNQKHDAPTEARLPQMLCSGSRGESRLRADRMGDFFCCFFRFRLGLRFLLLLCVFCRRNTSGKRSSGRSSSSQTTRTASNSSIGNRTASFLPWTSRYVWESVCLSRTAFAALGAPLPPPVLSVEIEISQCSLNLFKPILCQRRSHVPVFPLNQT